MNPVTISDQITALIDTLGAIGAPLQGILVGVAALLVAAVAVPALRPWLRQMVALATAVLVAGELLLVWFHWRLYQAAIIVSPDTGAITGRVAAPLWIESEKLYVWALIVAVMALAARRHREELLPGAALALAVLMAGAALWGRPFTEPLPSFLGQYGGYLSAVASGQPQSAYGAYQGMESARQYYYNTWFMWVHPPLLFWGYGRSRCRSSRPCRCCARATRRSRRRRTGGCALATCRSRLACCWASRGRSWRGRATRGGGAARSTCRS